MVAAEARASPVRQSSGRPAEMQATLASMHPEIHAAVVMHSQSPQDERVTHELANDELRDANLFGTSQIPCFAHFDASKAEVENMEQTHECVMFAAVMRYRQNVVHIPRKYYETCPDFGTVYAAVKNMGKGGSTSIGDRASTRGTRNRGEEEKPKQDEKKVSQVPQSPKRYYIVCNFIGMYVVLFTSNTIEGSLLTHVFG